VFPGALSSSQNEYICEYAFNFDYFTLFFLRIVVEYFEFI